MILKLHITTTVSEGPLGYFRRDAERLHQLFSSVDLQDLVDLHCIHQSADLVVFVGSADRALRDVRNSPIYRRDPSKCFAFHSGDAPLPTVPGIYASLPKRWFNPAVHRPGFYLRTVLDDGIPDYASVDARYLYTFVGTGANHPVRSAVLKLLSPDALLHDSGLHPEALHEARARFLYSLRDSMFVLCPRGGGSSSFRIFETMRAGRVPVIISDDWLEPQGPDWTSFSLRVPEADVADIPRILNQRRWKGRQMGICARNAWEQWFSPESAGLTLLRWILELRAEARDRRAYRIPPALAMYSRLAALRGFTGAAWKGISADG